MNHPLRTALAVLALVPFTFATSPQAPPYHRYIVSGSIQRPGGGPKASFVVTLVARISRPLPDSVYEFGEPELAVQGDVWRAVTDSTGTFRLQASSVWKADSLAVRVASVDRPAITGTFHALPGSFETITEQYRDQATGCTGCAADPEIHERVVSYRYTLDQVNAAVPY